MKKIYGFIILLMAGCSIAEAQWSLTGNAVSSGNFLGTTNAQNLLFKVNNTNAGLIQAGNYNTFYGLGTGGDITNINNIQNTALGGYVLGHNVSGGYNVGVGFYALAQNSGGGTNTATGMDALYSNTTGSSNTASGVVSLFRNTTGNLNCGFGVNTLFTNTTGSYNSACGGYALYYNVSGNNNTAMGYQALYSNTVDGNTAFGYQSMYSNTTGTGNTATGISSMYSNTTGSNNTANGYNALTGNTTGSNNTAIGNGSLAGNNGDNNTALGSGTLAQNNTGSANTAVGSNALLSNSSGLQNVGVGSKALYSNSTGSYNVAIGGQALYYNVSGSTNTALGDNAGPGVGYTNLSNTVAIGYQAMPWTSNQAMIGNTITTSIGGYANWTNFSDGRYKKNVQENVPGLEFINQLRPVTYTLDVKGIDRFLRPGGNIDADGKSIAMPASYEEGVTEKEKIVYTGFISQEVEAAAKKINYDFSGVAVPKNSKELYGIRYADFVAPLVKSVQQLSKANDSIHNSIDQLQSQVKFILEEINNLKANRPAAGAASLEQNMPNPANNSTIIGYNIPATAGTASISFNNAAGQLLKTVTISGRGAGQMTISAGEFAAGVYYYSLSINGKIVDTKQMVLTK